MARRPRLVLPDTPHHVAQRGIRRMDIFRTDADRRDFVQLLKLQTSRFDVQIWAYALMSNHFHLIAVPSTREALSAAMRDTLSDYALLFNERYGYTGHLWQARFFSSVLDGGYLWNALRYVERNPLKAGMVTRAEDHEWSSAAFHCGLRAADPLVSTNDLLASMIPDWSAWLNAPESQDEFQLLRQNTRLGRVSGTEPFIRSIERQYGIQLRPKKSGPPKGSPGRR